MGQRIRSTLVWLYLFAMWCGSLALFCLLDYELSAQLLPTAMFLTALIFVAEAMPIRLPEIPGTVSVSSVMIYASVILLGPIAGGVCAAIGTIDPREIKGKVPVKAFVFNRVQAFLAATLSGVAFVATGGSLQGISASDVLPMLAGATMLFAANFLFNIVYFSLSTGKSFISMVVSNYGWLIPNYLGLLPLAYVIVAVYQSVGALGVLFFFLPLMVGRYSFKMYEDMRNLYRGTIRSLVAALEARDPYTSGHAERVANWAVRVGQKMGLSGERLNLLEYIAMLHDIGKIGISDFILNKPGKYTRREREQMRQHSVIGARIVADVGNLNRGAPWIRHHHEHYDGRGYPDALSGEDIDLEARIIAVCDAFDAMLSERPYKQPLDLDSAIAELRRYAGSQFDPEVVEAFLQVVEAFTPQERRLLSHEGGRSEVAATDEEG